MKPKNLFSARIVPFMIIILATVLLYSFYFLYYIPKQESQVEQRAFRIMKEFAKNIHDKLDYYDAHFKNYSFFYAIEHLVDDETPQLEDSVKLEIKKKIADNKQAKKLIENLNKSINTDIVTVTKNDKERKLEVHEEISQFRFISNIDSVSYDKGLKELKLSKDTIAIIFKSLKVDTIRIASSRQMHVVDYVKIPITMKNLGVDSAKIADALKSLFVDSEKIADAPQSLDADSVKTTNNPDNTETKYSSAVHYVPMTTFMEHLKFDKLLNNIVLFCDTSIIYNSSPEVIQDITNPGMLADTVKKMQGGLIQKINIRGETNHVMVLPIDFLGNRLYLAGFITETGFRQKTRHINSQFLIILGGIFLLLLFSMPILKIFLISRNEQLHSRDCTAGTFSLIIAAGFSILIVVSVMKHYVVDKHYLQERIENISNTLYNNVICDFEFIKTLYQCIIEHENTSKDSIEPLGTLIKTVNAAFTGSNNNFRDIPVDYQKKGLPLNEIFLIDSIGEISKAVTSTGLSGLVPSNLEKRRYYSYLKDNSGKSWTYKNSYDTIQKYYIESLKSYNSGEKEVAFSFRLSEKASKNFGTKILAITSPLPSLYSQILPEDMIFMIINDKGDVLFHSNKSKNLHENFLAECSENKYLEGLLKHRVTDITRIVYNEKQWLARVYPIEDAPLFHITLIDLQHTYNKNARILIYTFYFMLATFILILIGTGIIQLSNPDISKSLSKQWLFYWLQFSEENRDPYLQLLVIQTAILLCQIAGILISDKPVTMFIYQMFFIVISVYFAMSILKYDQNGKAEKRSTTPALPQIILFLIMLILTGIFITFYITTTFRDDNSFIYVIQKNILLLPVVLLLILSFSYGIVKKLLVILSIGFPAKTIFHIYVFTWLIGISAIPALQYYQSVKEQEEDLWKRHKLEYIAMRNMVLMHEYKRDMENEKWHDRVKGNNLDSLTITYKTDERNDSLKSFKGEACELSPADRFYTWLPDPLTKGNHLAGLLNNRSTHMEWWRETINDTIICKKVCDNELVYSQPGYYRYISVKQNGNIKLGAGKWFLYFTVPILLVIALLWYLFRYVSRFVLRTVTVDWKEPAVPGWENVIGNDNIKQILLCSLTGEQYLEETRNHIKEKSRSVKNHKKPELLVAGIKEIIEEMKKPGYQYVDIIWIKGIGKLIKDPEAFVNQLPDLYQLTSDSKAQMIIEIPFGLDYLREYYESLLKESTLEKAEKALIESTICKIDELFSSFYIYTGKFIPEETYAVSSSTDSNQTGNTREDDERQQASYYAFKSRYRHIWNNLTSLEKLTLIDLSADGMINFKNKHSIDQLRIKGLIELTPDPAITCNNFQRFLTNDIDREETKKIQDNLGKQGKWHNNRYLILLAIIPLIIFIFISQGTSIDRVFAISTGGLAVLAGIMRLFDTNIFSQFPGTD